MYDVFQRHLMGLLSWCICRTGPSRKSGWALLLFRTPEEFHRESSDSWSADSPCQEWNKNQYQGGKRKVQDIKERIGGDAGTPIKQSIPRFSSY
jgi:hypothetical protein